MVQNTARLILCLLAGHVFLVSASYKECEPQEYARCNRAFTEEFENDDQNLNLLDIYCNAYKEKIQCLASNAKCVGKTIDYIRFAVLQHATIDKTLGTCPNIDLKPLRKVAQGYKKYHMKIDGLKDLETDQFQPCAAKKNLYCASRYAEEMKSGKKLCQVLRNFFKCYESNTFSCDDEIYKDYVATAKKSNALILKKFVKKFPIVMPGC